MSNSHLDDKMKVKKGIPKIGIASNNIEKAKRLASDKDLIHRKIQLWANKEENEYAIRLLLNGDPQYEMREKVGRREFIASTNPKERYTHPIAETDKLDLLQNGWDYALKDFVENYKKEYGVNPDMYAGNGYEAMYILAEAIKQAGSDDREAIKNAMSKMKDLPGITGPTTFDENGQAEKKMLFVEIQDGVRVPIGESK